LDKHLPHKAPYKRVKALLYYMAVETAQPHLRSKLAPLVISTEAEQPMTTLRRVIKDLHTYLQEKANASTFILADHETLQFNPASDHWLDVAEFQTLLKRTRLHVHTSLRTCLACQTHLAQAVALYQGAFLDGFYLGDCLLDDWIEMNRQDFHRQMVTALTQLVEAYTWRGAFAEALDAAQRWLHLEPTNENAQRKVWRLLGWTGQSERVLAQIQQTPAKWQTCEAETRQLSQQFQTQKDAFRHSLPPQATPFIRREGDLHNLQRKLNHPRSRAILITGAGGQGKTRLAWQVAQSQLGAFADGVFWIPVGTLSTGAFLAQLTAQKLGLSLAGSTSPETQVQTYLRDRHLLLVFDGADKCKTHLETWLAELLPACPRLQLLTTSREPLTLPETIPLLRIPLSIDKFFTQAESTPSEMGLVWKLSGLLPQDGVQLFIERAVQVAPDFQVSNASAPLVAQIHHLLGGLSLALELSAVHLADIPVEQLIHELEKRLETLTSPVSIHHLLWEVLAWHTATLSGPARTLFQELAIFTDGATLPAIQAVCTPPPAQENFPTLLQTLVRQALLREERGKGEPRYTMLDEIRDFAREQLRAAGAETSLTLRHLAYFLALAEQAEPELRGRAQQTWLDLLQTEQQNLRTALDTALTYPQPAQAHRLAGALWRFWHMRGALQEGMGWLQAVLKSSPPRADRPYLKVLTGAGNLSQIIGYLDQAQGYFHEALPLADQLADRHAQAGLASNLGGLLFHRGQLSEARPYYQQSIAQFQALGESLLVAHISINLGSIAQGLGDFESARQIYETNLAVLQAHGDQYAIGVLLLNMGALYSKMGQKESATQRYLESLQVRETINDRLGIAHCCTNLGSLACKRGDEHAAWAYYRRGLTLSQEVDNTYLMSAILEGIALLDIQAGQWARATRWMGAAIAWRAARGGQHSPESLKETEATLTQLQAQLDAATFAQAWAEGQALSVEAGVKEILEHSLD
jgi:predicted ATPase/DNA-binding SARP family transcriptional activator/Tfp pilus assembly protein PilF